jgi:hypothetical protein
VTAGAETPFVLRPVDKDANTAETRAKFILVGRPRDGTVRAINSSSIPGQFDSVNDSKLDIGGSVLGNELPSGFRLPAPHYEKTRIYTVVGEWYVHGIMDGSFMGYVERLSELH